MKRKIICCCLCLMLILMLTACDKSDNDIKINRFTAIEEDFLYYANDTHIVYYLVSYRTGHRGFGFMSPYYDSNGKMCKYENYGMVEIK